jgi:hypothetical protein
MIRKNKPSLLANTALLYRCRTVWYPATNASEQHAASIFRVWIGDSTFIRNGSIRLYDISSKKIPILHWRWHQNVEDYYLPECTRSAIRPSWMPSGMWRRVCFIPPKRRFLEDSHRAISHIFIVTAVKTTNPIHKSSNSWRLEFHDLCP